MHSVHEHDLDDVPDGEPYDVDSPNLPSYAASSGHVAPLPRNLGSEDHALARSHGFPAGLFVVRNRSSSKCLDARGAGDSPGTEVMAYSLKDLRMYNDSLMHKRNNQLFFLDWSGHLCAASSSLAVDVSGSAVHLSHTSRPIQALPTPETHPIPQFRYDPITATISVHFSYDPSFSGATNPEVWSNVDYLLEIVPQRRADDPLPSAGNPLDKLSEWLPFGNLFGSAGPPTAGPSTASPAAAPRSQTVDDPFLDDSLEPGRELRVVSLAPGWREKFPPPGTPRNSPLVRPWLRRQWDIAPILTGPGTDQEGGVERGRGGMHGSRAATTLERHPLPPSPLEPVAVRNAALPPPPQSQAATPSVAITGEATPSPSIASQVTASVDADAVAIEPDELSVPPSATATPRPEVSAAASASPPTTSEAPAE